MGQSASKAASRVSSRISQSVSKQSQQPPSSTTQHARPDPITGFTRGHGPSNPRDEQQQQFLQSQSTADAPTDMPADLLQFLNDAGPLKRPQQQDASAAAHNKRLPRIPGLDPQQPPQEIANNNNDSSASPHADPTRTRQVMPLMASLEQFGTERTTSFSTKADTVDPNDFGLDVLDLYRLLARRSGVDETMTAGTHDNPQHAALLQQTRQYLHAPVILKDDDGSFVGAFARDAGRLQNMKLQLMPKMSVKLVLEDLVDTAEHNEETTTDSPKQLPVGE